MTMELKDLAVRVAELRNRLAAGEEVTLTDNGAAVGTVRPEPPPAPPGPPQRLGFAPGVVTWIAPDFDAPLPDEFWFGGE